MKDKESRLIIQEGISTNALEALMKNYRDSQQAFMEIVDNAVDNRIDGKTLTVRIRVSRDELSVANAGGEGLDLSGLQNYFTWGHSEKTGRIGQFGVGGKAAMGYLGQGMEIVCSPAGSDREYKVKDPSWESRDEGLKNFRAEEGKASESDGYFRVRITGVKKEVNANALTHKLADVYRPLLMDESIVITVNGIQISPLEIRYLDSDPNLLPQSLRIQTRLGEIVRARLGFLEEGQKGIKPGLRCYYRGRLIEESEFFGQSGPAQIPGTSRFIGEVHMDSVPVTANKSSFDHGSAEYKSVASRMHDVLTPWIAKASKLRLREEVLVDKNEKALAQKVKKIMQGIVAGTDLITIKDTPGAATGRIPPQGEVQRPTPTGTHRPPAEINGRTAPRSDATGEKVKRWGLTHEFDVRPMGSEEIRSEIVDEDGKKILVINANYALYQATKMLGEESHQIYMGQTVALELAKVVAKERSVLDYTDFLNKMDVEFGRVVRNQIAERRRK